LQALPVPVPTPNIGQKRMRLSEVPGYHPLSALPGALAFPVVDPREIEREMAMIEQLWPDQLFTSDARKARQVWLADPVENRTQRAFAKFLAEAELWRKLAILYKQMAEHDVRYATLSKQLAVSNRLIKRPREDDEAPPESDTSDSDDEKLPAAPAPAPAASRKPSRKKPSKKTSAPKAGRKRHKIKSLIRGLERAGIADRLEEPDLS